MRRCVAQDVGALHAAMALSFGWTNPEAEYSQI